MDAKELQIGDLVKLKGYDYYYKVESIFYNAIRIELDHNIMDIEIDRFEPIPLTEEILKANGFEFDEIDDGWYNDKIDNLYQDKSGYYKYLDGKEVRFDSVHILQQYMRLLGLNILADNFKV